MLFFSSGAFAGNDLSKDHSREGTGFIENKGQIIDQNQNPNPGVQYLLPIPGMNVQLRRGGFSYDAYEITNYELRITSYDFPPRLQERGSGGEVQFHRIDIDLLGFNPAYTIETGPPSSDYINYYTAGTTTEGATFVHSFQKVTYRNIYPGTDLEFIIDEEGVFEYTFILQPGADLSAIKLKVEGPDKVKTTQDRLTYKTDIGKIEESIPICYYTSNGLKTEVKGSFYKIDKDIFGFRIDQKIPKDATLTIDPIPTRNWGTYYGGEDQEECPWGKSAAAMKDGTNIYCGSTWSFNNIATSGAHQSTFGGYCDAFLVKFNLAGQRQWATYYGGESGDWGVSVANDMLGNIFMGGRTWSLTNIYTTGAFDTTLEGLDDAFLVKFDPDGVRQWGTYYGGTGTLVDEFFTSISIDTNNNIYCAGYTSSANNIATPGSQQPVFGGLPSDVFLTKWNESGQRIWGTYYGGSMQDDNAKCCVTKDGTVFLSGCTLSPNNIATPGSFMPNIGAPPTGFLASFNSSGVRQWGTYYGGEASDQVTGCAADTGLYVYITGSTGSSSNMATPGAFQTTFIGPQACAFLAKFDIAGNRIWSTYYGAGGESAYDVAVDDSGYVFITGTVNNQDNIIATSDGYQTVWGGNNDGFLAKFSGDDKRQWGTYYGGESWDLSLSIVTDTSDHVFIEGYTTSTIKIASSNGEQTAYGGNWDCFMVRFNDCYSPDSANVINGPDTVCQYTDGIVYTIADIPLATGYLWAGSTSLSITAGQNTTSATFSFGYKTGNATISVYGYNECGEGVIKTKTVFVKPRPVPAMSGQDTVCQGATKLYWTSSGKSYYQWTVSPGGIITTLGTSNDSSAYIQWNSSGIQWVNVNYTDTNGCDGLLPAQINVLVTPSPAADITVIASANPVCEGTVVNFFATPANGGATPTYQWTVNGINAGSNSTSYSYIPVNGDIVICTMTSSDSCVSNNPAGSNPITMSVGLILPVSISISASENPVCAGTSVTFTATPVNGGTTPVFQWYVNDIPVGINSSVLTYVPGTGDQVTCDLTSSETVCVTNNPATSNKILMVIDSNLLVGVSISASANPVCEGTSVTYTATPINGGTTPIFQWYVNGISVGINSPVYAYVPVTGDQVTCDLTSSETVCVTNNSATSNSILMVVDSNLLVSVSISASANPVCEGTSVTYTATPINGGTTPIFQWYVNGMPVGVNSSVFTYVPGTGDQVTCDLTSSETVCVTNNPATSNSILMVIDSNLLVSVSISAAANPVCEGTSVTYTAMPVNGGTAPVFQWYVDGISVGTNSPVFIYIPSNGNSVSCLLNSDYLCTTGNPAMSNPIVMNVVAKPVVTFQACFDTITTVNAKPIKLKGGIPLGGIYSGTGVNAGIFYPAIAGPGTHVLTYTYTNAGSCSSFNQISIVNYPLSIINCGSPITDRRDNKVYPTIQIGTQCWLAANLNYGNPVPSAEYQRDNCIPEKYCYNDIPANCQLPTANSYYQWDELMAYDAIPGNQGLCPPAWHVPTEAEWNTLFAVYINNGFAGSPLKYSGYSGFNALLTGAKHFNKAWNYNGFAAFFWSSTSWGPTKAWAHGMNDPDPSVSRYPSYRTNAFSVRCLKD